MRVYENTYYLIFRSLYNQHTIMNYPLSHRNRKSANSGKSSTRRTSRANLKKSGRGKRQDRGRIPYTKHSCILIKTADSLQLTCRMSPESRRISIETKWSEKGFVPSFEVTDKILMEATRRTYKTLGITNR